MLEIINLVTILDAFSHDQIHITAHTYESADSPRMPNEPRSTSHDEQPINVDAPGHVVLHRDVDMPSGEFDVGADDEIPISNLFQTSFSKKTLLLYHRCSRHNLLSHRYHINEDESPLNNSREKCARNSQLRLFTRSLPMKQLWHPVRVAGSLLACRRNNRKMVLK